MVDTGADLNSICSVASETKETTIAFTFGPRLPRICDNEIFWLCQGTLQQIIPSLFLRPNQPNT